MDLSIESRLWTRDIWLLRVLRHCRIRFFTVIPQHVRLFIDIEMILTM